MDERERSARLNRSRRANRSGRADGFWLVEAVVAAGLLALVSAGLAQLLVMSQRATARTSRETLALLLAVQKIEQLQGLTWTYWNPGLVPTSDLSTDVTVESQRVSGERAGTGLQVVGAEALSSDVPGYVDYLDPYGGWLGTGTAPPSAGFAYVRRWSVRPHRRAPRDLLVLDVVVLPAQWVGRAGGASPVRSDPGVVWLTALKGRR